MDTNPKDEIIEELWEIKEQLSASCNNNIRQLVQLVNEIAEKQNFDKGSKQKEVKTVA